MNDDQHPRSDSTGTSITTASIAAASITTASIVIASTVDDDAFLCVFCGVLSADDEFLHSNPRCPRYVDPFVRVVKETWRRAMLDAVTEARRRDRDND